MGLGAAGGIFSRQGEPGRDLNSQDTSQFLDILLRQPDLQFRPRRDIGSSHLTGAVGCTSNLLPV